MERVASVEPSSTTSSSQSSARAKPGSACARRDSRQGRRTSASLRAGTITDRRIADLPFRAPFARCHYYRNVTKGCRASLCLLVLLLAAGCDRGDHPKQLDKPAPNFTLIDGSQRVELSKYRGKVVVLNFWASWCAPCIEEIPSLNQLQQEMPQLVVLAVSVDQDEGAYRRFLATHRVDFTTIRDGDQRSNALYGTFVFPDTYIIDRNGRIRRKFINAQDWTSPEILHYLSQL